MPSAPVRSVSHGLQITIVRHRIQCRIYPSDEDTDGSLAVDTLIRREEFNIFNIILFLIAKLWLQVPFSWAAVGLITIA